MFDLFAIIVASSCSLKVCEDSVSETDAFIYPVDDEVLPGAAKLPTNGWVVVSAQELCVASATGLWVFTLCFESSESEIRTEVV